MLSVCAVANGGVGVVGTPVVAMADTECVVSGESGADTVDEVSTEVPVVVASICADVRVAVVNML